ncbi:hypothetical protein RB195_001367 [Necator americanus]|uniref:Uncharacterized protein n=1 Tax=Necator americanus TaxID=51031 RepID=A0ABR1DE22_NECAM
MGLQCLWKILGVDTRLARNIAVLLKVNCDGLNVVGTESFGRRKRESMKDLTTLLKRSKPNFTTNQPKQPRIPMIKRIVTGTITITEVEKKQKRPKPEFSSMPDDRYCILRPHLVAALVAFCVLSITQLFVLLNCLHNRYTSFQGNSSYPSSSSSFVSSCEYRGSSLDMTKPLPPTPNQRATLQQYELSISPR